MPQLPAWRSLRPGKCAGVRKDAGNRVGILKLRRKLLRIGRIVGWLTGRRHWCGAGRNRLVCRSRGRVRTGRRRVRLRRVRHRGHRALRIQQMILARTKSETDQRARIRDLLALPSVIGLVLAHGIFAGLVPGSGGLALQIVLPDQSFLDRLRALGVNLLLSAWPPFTRRPLPRSLGRSLLCSSGTGAGNVRGGMLLRRTLAG